VLFVYTIDFFFFVDFAVPMNLGIFNINNEEIKINPYGS
jgi:hypothetical protein